MRRTLSENHLLSSSAFVVRKTADGFTLHGVGLGYAVGLCRTGVAEMGECGYAHEEDSF